MNRDCIINKSKEILNRIEDLNGGRPYGTCHLIAHLMSMGLTQIGFESKSVTGTLMLRDKNNKQIIYSDRNPNNNNNVGYYHTWCETNIDGKSYIIDPSLGLNIDFLKSSMKIKIHPKIPEILYSDNFQTYYYSYSEKPSLEVLANKQLMEIPTPILERLEIISKELFKNN